MNIFSSDFGKNKFFEILNKIPVINSLTEDEQLLLIKDVCKVCPMAGYYASLDSDFLRAGISDILKETSGEYLKSISDFEVSNTKIDKKYNNAQVDELILSFMAYLLCKTDSDDFKDILFELWDNKVLAATKREKNYKYVKIISLLNEMELDLPKLSKSSEEMILYMSYFLYANQRHEYDFGSNELEFYSIHMHKVYRIDEMCEEDKHRLVELYNLMCDRNDEMSLPSFIRKIDRDFEDYESVFGMSKKDFMIRALEVGGDEITMPYRMLRNFYSDYSTDPDWIRFINENSTDKRTVDWCNYYDIFENIATKARESVDEESFFTYFKAKLDEHKDRDFVCIKKMEVKKMRLAQGNLFINVLIRGYDIKRVISLMDAKNLYVYDRDYFASFGVFDDEQSKNNKISAIDSFYDKYNDPEDMVFIYMNSILHEIADIRFLIETICNIYKNQGLKSKQVSDRVSKLFDSYTMKGTIKRVDEQFSFKGLYTIEPYNIFKNPENMWNVIHSTEAKYTHTEKIEKCQLLFKSDRENGEHGYWRFEKDAHLYFKITGVEKKLADTYTDCDIFVGKLWPLTNRDGSFTGVNVSNKIAIRKALDDARDWLETLMTWDFNRENPISMPKGFQLYVNPSTQGRDAEFAVLILDLLTHYMKDEKVFGIVFSYLNKNFVDNLNEYMYKPAMINRTAERIRFSTKEKQYIIAKAKEILESDIPTKRKMQIYMNTCLKCVYYLDRFLWRLPKDDRPLLFSETDEHMYYLFPVIFKEENEDSFRFAFRCGQSSLYKDDLYIGKNSINPDLYEKYKTDLNLFAEIHFFSEKEKRAQLYQIFTKEEAKSDSGQKLRRALNDLKKDADPVNMRKGIEEIVSLVPARANIMDSSYVNQFIEKFHFAFDAHGFDAIFILNFFAYFNKVIGHDYIPEESIISEKSREYIVEMLNRIMQVEGVVAGNILAVYKHSYCCYACSKEQMINKMSEKFELDIDAVKKQYDADSEYAFTQMALLYCN